FPPRPMRSPAQVAELVDAHGSGPCAARRGGSSPLLGTILRGFDVHRRLEKSRKSKEFQKITSGGVFWCLLASRKLVGVFVGIKITVPNTDRHMAADKFSDVALRSIKPRNKQFKLSDGGGLFLLVNPSGS